ncbi:MAG: hypothetical protein WBM76_18420, partial [Woeseiaceae bacterium]
EIQEAIREEESMRFLACLPDTDIDSIAAFLRGSDSGVDSDDDDEDDSERNGGGSGDLPFLLMLGALALSRMMGRRN